MDSFTDFDSYYQARLIHHLSKCSSDRKNLIYRYNKTLRKFTAELPPLIDVDSEVPWKKISHIGTFGVLVN